MNTLDHKSKAALLSVLSNLLLIVGKLIAGFLMNSVSIISEAVHSFTDLLAALIAFFSIRVSSHPADKEHPYGHGKFEEVSGFAEGVLILLAAGYIIYESIQKITSGKIDYVDSYAGIVIMAISVILNFFVSRHLFHVAKATDSIALHADAEHLRTDILTSLGVLIGLILIKLTGIKLFDPIVAILVTTLIIKAGWELCASSLKNLLDVSLSESDIEKINAVFRTYSSERIAMFKDLKTRKSGADKFIEFKILLPSDMTLKESHDLCDRIEEELMQNIANTTITIHAEPCDENDCSQCNLAACCDEKNSGLV